MIENILEYIKENYPEIKVIDYKISSPKKIKVESGTKVEPGETTFHFTFNHEGNTFHGMFFERPREPISEQFNRILFKKGIKLYKGKRLYKGQIDKNLEMILDQIVEKFPAGRMTAYIINNMHPDVYSIINDLKSFNFDSDNRYRDDESIRDARKFAKQLNEFLKI